MKHKALISLIPLLSLPLLGFSQKIINPTKTFTMNFDPIGPFEVGADDYTLTGTITSSGTFESIQERMYVYVTGGSVVKTQFLTTHSVIRNLGYEVSFVLPFKSALTTKGLTIDIKIYNMKVGIDIQTLEFQIKPINPKTINPSSYTSSYYVDEDIVVDPDNYSSYYGEMVKFNKFVDYFDVDTYYRLPLDGLVITYKCAKSCPSVYAHLHFVDYLGLFPYLDNDSSIPEFDIPLISYNSSSYVYFKYENTMYVNPTTLEMSLEARPGFTPTSYFYLPKNRCEELLDQVFTFEVDSFGYGQNNFSIDVRYLNNHRLIGDCSYSDYCVIGEQG